MRSPLRELYFAWVALALLPGCSDGPERAGDPAPARSSEATTAATLAPASAAASSSAAPSASAAIRDADLARAREASEVKSDEVVILFPAAAARTPSGGWELELEGWIFEPEVGDPLREKAIHELKEALAVPEDDASARILTERVRPFLADNERDKRVSVELAGRVFALGPSSEDGRLVGHLELTDAEARAHATGGTLTATVALPPGDARDMKTEVRLVEPEGLTIVSDIDDTVKVTEVTNKRRLLERTFLLPFEAVPGMAPKYTAWLGAEGHLHFVSSSPWQLYAPIAELMRAAGFPAATYALKDVRPRDIPTTAETLLADPTRTKPEAIRRLMDRYPKRRLVLVGDSGEKDPEVYAPFLREHPDRVVRVYIRDVTGEPRDAPRYAKVFEGLPAEKWVVFRDASELPSAP